MATFPFEITATAGAARTGRVRTPRGDIRTPAFMPVGTAGTVKALYMDQVASTGADIILGNTYHLMLRPGAERVKALGGLHAFAKWSGPMLTDSCARWMPMASPSRAISMAPRTASHPPITPQAAIRIMKARMSPAVVAAILFMT